MDFLQSLLDNSSVPVITAFILGILTAISPCPLATNITAIGFIGKDIENRHRIFINGLLYTFGRIVTYTVLGFILWFFAEENARHAFSGSAAEQVRDCHAVKQCVALCYMQYDIILHFVPVFKPVFLLSVQISVGAA